MMMPIFPAPTNIPRADPHPNSLNKSNGLNVSAHNCPVCYNAFQTDSVPKSLQCGHTICSTCCRELTKDSVIYCPMCRNMTLVPPEGLPTNYALLDSITQSTARVAAANRKPYNCLECNRSCSAEEAWLCKRPACIDGRNINALLLCSHCVIRGHADHGRNGAELESVSDTLTQYESLITDVKKEADGDAEIQFQWSETVKNMVGEMTACANEMLETSHRLAQSARNDVQKVEKEYGAIRQATRALNITDSRFNVLDGVQRSVQEIRNRFKELRDGRQNTLARTESAMQALRIGLDCLLNIEHEQGGVSTSSIAATPAVVMQPQRQMQMPARPKSPAPPPLPPLPPARAPTPIMSPLLNLSMASDFGGGDMMSSSSPPLAMQPRRPQPMGAPRPPPKSNVRTDANQAISANKSHDTSQPLTPFTPASMVFNPLLNQSSFMATSTPRSINSSFFSSNASTVAPAARRGPKSTTSNASNAGSLASSTMAAAGSEYMRLPYRSGPSDNMRQAYRGGYRK